MGWWPCRQAGCESDGLGRLGGGVRCRGTVRGSVLGGGAGPDPQLYRIEDTCREMSADERRFRSLPIGSRPTAVVLPIPRVECRACGAVRQVMVPFADPRREVPPPSVVERRHLGESCGLAVGDPIADPGLRASQESWTAQAYTGRRDRSSAFRLHLSGGSAVIATERPGRRDRPDR